MCFSVLELLTNYSAKAIGIMPVQGRCAKIYKLMFGINNSKEDAKIHDQTPIKKKDGLINDA